MLGIHVWVKSPHWIRKARASGWYNIVEFKLIRVSFWIKWCSHMLYYLLNWISLRSNLPSNNIKEKRIEKKFLMLIDSFLITTVLTLNYLLSLLFNFVSDVIHFIISKYDAWFLWLNSNGISIWTHFSYHLYRDEDILGTLLE